MRAPPLLTAILLPAILLATATPSWARPDETSARAQAKHHYESGMAHFNLREYKDAIADFQAAYRIHPDPAFLYNLAQSYRLSDDPDQALYFYRAYLRARPDASNRDEVEQRITDLRAVLAAKKDAARPPVDTIPPSDKPAETANEPSAPTTAPPPSSAHVQPSPTSAPPPTSAAAAAGAQPHAGRTLVIAGLSVAAVGVAALGAGAGLAVLAKQAGDTLSSSASGQVYDSGLDRRGHTYDAASVALLAVGGAAVVGGGVAALLGWRQQRARRFAVVPVVGPSQAGVHASLRF